MKILNLTQHTATPEQLADGVMDLPAEAREALQVLLTFDRPVLCDEVAARAADIAELAAQFVPLAAGEFGHHFFAGQAMIGGAPYLMAPLERALRDHGIEPLYAFSARESAEQQQPDGSVRKINVFRHAGFVRACEAR